MEKEKVVVITGSTRGIGYALARAFCSRGCRVVISGRRQESVRAAMDKLNAETAAGSAAGITCDVTRMDDLEGLWNFAVKEFGSVDMWINNAGISNQLNAIVDVPEKEIRCVVETNILGGILGTQAALRGFKNQGYGALYNMEGMGSKKGRKVDGLSIYGTTKAGLRYFNDAIAHENQQEKILIGALLPGMVLTEMVTGQYVGDPEGWKQVEGIFAAIAEDVDTVANWLVEKMLSNEKNGVRFSFSNPLKIMLRMLKYALGRKPRKTGG